MIKTDFDMVLQGYIVPEAMGAVLKQYSKKVYTKSIAYFTAETVESDIQNERPRHKINKVGDGGAGIGYDRIGDDTID